MPTLLILAASPLELGRLRTNNEVKGIKNALQLSYNREGWTIETNEATTVDDLRRSLLQFQPTIVHFAGHGGPNGIAFENESGETHVANIEPLARLFHQFKDTLKCVVLNACRSDAQAEAIRQQVDYVIGMSSDVDDESATKFAVAFYDAVFAATTFRSAFELGCTAVDLRRYFKT